MKLEDLRVVIQKDLIYANPKLCLKAGAIGFITDLGYYHAAHQHLLTVNVNGTHYIVDLEDVELASPDMDTRI